ncbi:uncharacterized protein BP5553_08021 [Venustampulla echinocandica]|uniref:Uncharacterized protein n=1 Tax=Venustampulla echinocandica TaxID=2656787 RepID=A0A370TFH8_9HELO|nr:uncharacterized protein BP5553_08021 [Venustampulla echinocandica]RDL33653.1 hypothetical protein BP5553_08021 [Venustampulla echinocandica]
MENNSPDPSTNEAALDRDLKREAADRRAVTAGLTDPTTARTLQAAGDYAVSKRKQNKAEAQKRAEKLQEEMESASKKSSLLGAAPSPPVAPLLFFGPLPTPPIGTRRASCYTSTGAGG